MDDKYQATLRKRCFLDWHAATVARHVVRRVGQRRKWLAIKQWRGFTEESARAKVVRENGARQVIKTCLVVWRSLTQRRRCVRFCFLKWRGQVPRNAQRTARPTFDLCE